VAGYLGILANFDYELHHIKGVKNWANPLSQCPDHDDGREDNDAIIALPKEVFT
jgi:hypothetical protein